MKKIYTRLHVSPGMLRNRQVLLKGVFLSPFYWLLAWIRRGKGLGFHLRIAALGLRLWVRRRVGRSEAYWYAFFPMDSVRYLEFDILWHFLKGQRPRGRYLDVSSPRWFPILVHYAFGDLTGDFVNPDGKDLSSTEALLNRLGLSNRCHLHRENIDGMRFPDNTFDLITCISVVEHIPDGGDRIAVSTLWRLLAPGGRLLITVPVSCKGFEEYIDYDEYKLVRRDENGFVFGQYFYDDEAIHERILTVTGLPAQSAIFGEVRKGIFFRNRERKLKDPAYPFWREPYMMTAEYARFPSVKDLPGVGVIAMEFRKP